MVMPTTLTRTYYYQGELLGVPDFVRDQQYVRDLVAAQNQSLFSQGIAQGMKISGAAKALTVSIGLAFNGAGAPIILLAPLNVDITPYNLAAGVYYLSIIYSDSLTKNTPPATLQATQAIIEQPILVPPTTTKPSGPINVILGTMAIDAGGAIQSVDMSAGSGRQQAGILLSAAPPPPPPPPAPEAAVASQPAPSEEEPPAPASVPIARLRVGDRLAGTGEPAEAPLSVGLDFAAHPEQTAVASFRFQTAPDAGGVVSLGAAPSAGVSHLLDLVYNGTRVWSVDQDGAVHTQSDAYSKEDIAPIDNALELIRRLNGVSFLARSGSGRRRMGLLAQDVQAVLPDAVRADQGGALAVAYTDLIGVLVEAVKTLAARVEALEQSKDLSSSRKKS